MAHILIIDDDTMMNSALGSVVKRLGHEVCCAFTIKEGLEKTFSGAFDVIFLDVRLPDGNGLNILPKLRAAESSPEVIIITGYGDPDGAELAIKNGAWDYIRKPSSLDGMTLPLIRALQYREEKWAAKRPLLLKRQGIIGNSPAMTSALERLAQAAASTANVLIMGETGTGKELFARALHENSDRANERFVVVDCTALPESLVESILFGHEKGAFTSADKAKTGLIQQAAGGTLFLDEISELPFPVQASFLRVIQERRFRPIGSKHEIESDFRLVAATNRDLDEMVRSGEFREDLLFRLRAFTIEIPPLRERPEDIKDLVYYYTDRLCELYGIGTKGFSPEFFEVLSSYDWPGNVRELINTLEEMFALARYEPTLYPYHLPVHIRVKLARKSIDIAEKSDEDPLLGCWPELNDSNRLPVFKDFRNAIEKKYLSRLLDLAQGSRRKACEISGLSRTRLFELLKKHDLS